MTSLNQVNSSLRRWGNPYAGFPQTPSPTLRNLAVEYVKGSDATILVLNVAGNFVVAGANAVNVAKKLAEGKAGGKPDLAQGSIPNFAAQDAKQAIDALKKRL